MSQDRRGTVLALTAYLIWGLFPLYWPLLEPAGAVEILGHRVVWSLLSVAILISVTGGRRAWRAIPRDRRRLQLLVLAGLLIGVNWGLYIWGVNHGHVVETSLGYFINPLVTVGLSVVALGERLRRAEWAAVGIAALGVVVLTVQSGRPPWIALALAFSFGGYGLVKKVVGVEPAYGLFVEAAVLAPLALGYLAIEGAHGHSTFATHGAGHGALLASSGVVTMVPLLLFAAAAPLVPLSRLGLMQYLTPTIQFVIGVTVRHEPLPATRLAGFVLVWLALVMFAIRRGPSKLPLDAAPVDQDFGVRLSSVTE
ncbi:MAG TPA: EamA family transporter RarD [Mycobacteriales bacterium]|nr:EamA family transporter RarD [Mycobacteriales bacterium]